LAAAATLIGACGSDETSDSPTGPSSSPSSSSSGSGGEGVGAAGGQGASGGDGGMGGMPETCRDGIQNGEETDVDCGGSTCPACANGETCALPDDCTSGFCDHDGGGGGAGGGAGGGGGGRPDSGVCSPCETEGDCQPGQFCDAGSCVAGLDNGEVCAAANQCVSGFCVDGVCCDTACAGGDTSDCQACDVTGLVGTCSPETAATPCGDQGDTSCTNPDSCDGAGICVENDEPLGTACDNGLFCDGADECDGGGACDSAGDPCSAPQVCGEVTNACVAPPWINEFHYDNVGTDANEFIEIFVPSSIDIAQVQVVTYNGGNGAVLATHAGSSFTAGAVLASGTLYSLVLPVDGLQNGAPDGIALVVGDTVAQFLSYEGSFAATGGPAMGMTSTDIGIDEEPAGAAGTSLYLIGTGTQYSDFTWAGPLLATPGALNTGQIIN